MTHPRRKVGTSPPILPVIIGTKSRDRLHGTSVRIAEGAAEARKEADRLAGEAWNKRMLGFRGPAQPSPTLGDALNAAISISKSAAMAVIHIRLSRSTSCGGLE
jgi:hypothetical protein